MRSNGYQTKRRQKMLEFLQQHKENTVSAREILEHLQAENPKLSITTVYRYLDKLSQDGQVIKYTTKSGEKTGYQYVEQSSHCQEHLHIQCIHCGRVEHLDCAFMEKIREHINLDHGFILECGESVLYGVCRECQKKQTEEDGNA